MLRTVLPFAELYNNDGAKIQQRLGYWTEIVRRMSTQKAVTTEAVNALGEKVQVRLCSTPKKEAADIYEMLGYKKKPFWRKVKVCSTQKSNRERWNGGDSRKNGKSGSKLG